jgi:SSS family solute:Na+ symporter
MGVHWVAVGFELGAVISMGYWTTDFLVVQRVLSAHNLRTAQLYRPTLAHQRIVWRLYA